MTSHPQREIVPVLPARTHLGAAEAQRIGRELRRRYDAGDSVRRIVTQTGYSIGRVRRLLELAGVQYRPRGGPNRKGTPR